MHNISYVITYMLHHTTFFLKVLQNYILSEQQ